MTGGNDLSDIRRRHYVETVLNSLSFGERSVPLPFFQSQSQKSFRADRRIHCAAKSKGKPSPMLWRNSLGLREQLTNGSAKHPNHALLTRPYGEGGRLLP